MFIIRHGGSHYTSRNSECKYDCLDYEIPLEYTDEQNIGLVIAGITVVGRGSVIKGLFQYFFAHCKDFGLDFLARVAGCSLSHSNAALGFKDMAYALVPLTFDFASSHFLVNECHRRSARIFLH